MKHRARPRRSTARGRPRVRRAALGRRRADAGAFPLIADYAFLSDCEAVALVAPSGDVEWMCRPRPNSPRSVFGAILDRDAGTFRVGPADALVPAARRYLPGTMVLETTWMARAGWLIARDALLVGPWHHENERSGTHRRVPTEHEADHVLVRTVQCVQGSVELLLDCERHSTTGGCRPSGPSRVTHTAVRSQLLRHLSCGSG